MEKYRNTEVEVQELLETKSYEALNAVERECVHVVMSREEYEKRRLILNESKKLRTQAAPRPLVLPAQEKGRVVPLYQAVAGVAAAVILTFFLMRMNSVEISADEPKIVAHTDTVYQERLRVDTIYLIEKEQVRVQAAAQKLNNTAAVEMNPAPGNLNAIPLNRLDLENKGTSAENDASLSLIRNFQGLN
jgi:hypothetical protein